MNEAQQELKDRLKKKHAPSEEDGPVDDEGEEAEMSDLAEGQGERKFTYSKALERMGVSRESDAYRKSIEVALLWLRLNRPFYGFIIDEMTRQVTLSTPTAHVEVSSNGITMALNPDFFALLPLRHRAGVIMHECLHVMNLHVPRLKQAIGQWGRGIIMISNIAADLAVNSLLADPRDLPKYALRPEKFLIKNDQLPSQRSQFPARTTYEHYLALLRDLGLKEVIRQAGLAAGAAGHGPPVPDQVMGDDGACILDDHDPWLKTGANGLADVELLNEVVRERMRRATTKAAGRGITPGDLQSVIDELLKDKTVNFAQLFAGIVGRYVSQIRRTSMMRPSRRYPVPPGRVMGRKLDLRFYVDTSGSMSMEEIVVMLSEAAHAQDTGQAHVTVQQFDHALQGPPITAAEMGKINVGVRGRGGTSLASVIEDIDRHQPDLAIVGTDGGLEHDLRPKTRVPVAWVLTANGFDPGWGQAMRLPTLEEIRSGKKAQLSKR